MNVLNTGNYKDKIYHTTQNHLTTNQDGEFKNVSYKTNENFKLQKNKIDNSETNFLQKSSIVLIENNLKNSDLQQESWSRNKLIKKIESKHLNLYLFDDNNNEKNYLILHSKKEINHYTIYNQQNKELAKIKWNFLSSNFKVYDSNNNELLNVKYELNIKGLNGPTKMKIILSKNLNFNSREWYNQQTKSYDNDKVYLMENKQPVYNQIYKCYVLKFINRKIKTSTKNFQIIFKSNSIEEPNNILLQFAETEEGYFILDYKYPFNNITAFAIGIIANSSKFFCEY